MNFKEFIFTEEINPNDTATVYHRTKSVSTVSDILKSGFTPGEGAYYGKGLYTTISLESQFNENMLKYGSIIVKFQVTNLDKYLVFQPGMARRIHGQNSYKLSDQLKKFGLDHKFQPDYLSQLDQRQELTGHANAENLRNFYYQNKWIQNDPSIKGVIYYGTNDGYCLLKYEPVNDGTITMLAYVEADTSPEMMQKLYNNEGWITSTDRLKIRDIQKLPPDRRTDYTQISLVNVKTPAELYKFLKNNNDLSELGENYKEVIENILEKRSSLNDIIIGILLNRYQEFFLIYANNIDKVVKNFLTNNQELTDYNVGDLLHYASEKQEIAKLIIQNKKELSDKDVGELLHYASEKQEIAKLIIQNKKELNDADVSHLIYNASDKQEIIKLIIQNKEELNDNNVLNLLHYASEKQEIAKLIIQYKKELNETDVIWLLRYASDKQEIAKLIIQNKKELSDKDVYHLLLYATDKKEIAKDLGSININKLNYNYVSDLIIYKISYDRGLSRYENNDSNDKKIIAQIIDQYHTRKTPQIQELIKPYL